MSTCPTFADPTLKDSSARASHPHLVAVRKHVFEAAGEGACAQAVRVVEGEHSGQSSGYSTSRNSTQREERGR